MESWYHHRFITLSPVSLDIMYLKTEKQATGDMRLGLYKKQVLAMQSTLITIDFEDDQVAQC
jgi:hypothetical protein